MTHITLPRETVQQAIDALTYCEAHNSSMYHQKLQSITALRTALEAATAAPPPECKTEAEKTAYAAGWWKALEVNRAAPASPKEPTPEAKRIQSIFEATKDAFEGAKTLASGAAPAAQKVEPPNLLKHTAIQIPAQTIEPDVIVINGKRYAAALFGTDGFLAPAGTVLRIEDGPDDVITCTTLRAAPMVQEPQAERLEALNDIAALATVGATYPELMDYLQKEIEKCEATQKDVV